MLVHELAHALLDLWTGGFPYPPALQEGYAYVVERFVLGRFKPPAPTDAAPPQIPIANGRGSDVRPLTMRSLLSLRPRPDVAAEEQAYKEEYARITQSVRCLVGFLGALTIGGQPVLGEMLRGLRDKDARSPDAVYDWLLAASGLSENSLEQAYSEYSRNPGTRNPKIPQSGNGDILL
jgi:hypothetical protein